MEIRYHCIGRIEKGTAVDDAGYQLIHPSVSSTRRKTVPTDGTTSYTPNDTQKMIRCFAKPLFTHWFTIVSWFAALRLLYVLTIRIADMIAVRISDAGIE